MLNIIKSRLFIIIITRVDGQDEEKDNNNEEKKSCMTIAFLSLNPLNSEEESRIHLFFTCYSCNWSFYYTLSLSWTLNPKPIFRLSSSGHHHSSSSSHHHHHYHPHTHHHHDIYSSSHPQSHHLTPPSRHHASLHHRRASLASHDGSTRRASSPAAPRSYLEVRRGSAVPEAIRRKSLAHTAPSSANVSATSSLFDLPSPSLSAILSTGRRKSSTRFVLVVLVVSSGQNTE